MLANFSAKHFSALGLSGWVVLAFLSAQLITALLFALVIFVFPGAKTIDETVSTVVSTGLSYGLALTIAIGLPYVLFKRRTDLKTLGIQRLLSWSDIGFSLLAIVPYIIVTGLLGWFFTYVLTVIDQTQSQALPFHHLLQQYEFLLAFLTLIVIAPIAEELLFRGYLLGKLLKTHRVWVSIVVTALVFGLLHLPGFTADGNLQFQWGTVLDTFVLGLVLGGLRLLTGSIWAGILLHMFKNAVAYFILFIYPLLTGTM